MDKPAWKDSKFWTFVVTVVAMVIEKAAGVELNIELLVAHIVPLITYIIAKTTNEKKQAEIETKKLKE